MHKNNVRPGNRQWFKVQAKEGGLFETFIFDEIGAGFYGGGVAAADLIKEIKELNLKKTDTLNVHINSPGGNFFEGITIHNYLRTVPANLVVRIDGVAASAASIIAMAGDRVEMPENSMMFIHNPWTVAIGDAQAMRKAAGDLDQMRDSAASTYLRKTGDKLERGELLNMLDAETWLSAEESVKHGLADEVDEPVRAAALVQFDFESYGFKIPNALVTAKSEAAKDIQTRRQHLQLVKGKVTD